MLNDERVDQLVAHEAKRARPDGTKMRGGREVPNIVEMRELALDVFSGTPPSNSNGTGVGFTRAEAGHIAFNNYPELSGDQSAEAKAARSKLEGLIWRIASPRLNSPLNELLRSLGRPERIVQVRETRGVNPAVIRRLSLNATDLRDNALGTAVDRVVSVLGQALAVRDDVAANYPELASSLDEIIRTKLQPMLPAAREAGK